MPTSLRRAPALALACLLAVTSCTANDGKKKPLTAGCDLPAGFDPFHGSQIVVQTPGSFVLRDPSSLRVVAECAGNLLMTSRRRMSQASETTSSADFSLVRLRAVADPPLNATTSSADLRDVSSPLDQSDSQDPGVLISLPDEKDAKVAAAAGQRFTVAAAGPRLIIGRRSGHDFPQADDFCVIPRPSAPAADCTSIPGATGSGTPTVRADGSIGWAPTEVVPARFGSQQGFATTDGRGIVAFSRFRPGAKGQQFERSYVSPDGRSFAYFDDDNHLSWGIVRSITRTGVVGDLYMSTADVQTATGRNGFSVAAGGKSAEVMDALGNVSRVSAGSDRIVSLGTLSRRGEGTSENVLVHWPDSAPAR